jgi:hypothetical protein
MKNHFKLKREEAGTVIGQAIRPHCIKTPAIISIAQGKANRA